MLVKFLKELNDLQDKYGIYIDADSFTNKGGYEIQDIFKDKDNHYHHYILHN